MKNFISFEGGEGSGKTTQAKLLFKSIKNISKQIILTREPGGSREIDKIRKLIVNSKYYYDPLTELLLINAARKEHIKTVILPNLKCNNIVLCDRFVDSTYAYQIYAKNVKENIFLDLNKLVINDVLPSITFFIDLNPRIGIQRSLSRKNNETKFENYKLSYHKKVRTAFNLLDKLHNRILKVDGEKKKKRNTQINC